MSPSLLVNIINSNYKGMYKVILQVHSGMYIKIQHTTYAHIVFYFATIFNRECILQIKKNEVYMYYVYTDVFDDVHQSLKYVVYMFV